jgi:hypothetical protein
MQAMQTGRRSLEAENAAIVAKACRLIESSEVALSLDSLASTIGLSQSHLHRLFKGVIGITPKAYAIAQRAAACPITPEGVLPFTWSGRHSPTRVLRCSSLAFAQGP